MTGEARSGPFHPLRVCLVGSGTVFVSGISYYTYFLAEALSSHVEVSVVLMRRLIPAVLYPGRRRVGRPIMNMHVGDVCPTFDGVDWYGVPSVGRALRFMRRSEPDVVVLQWWSGSVLPWYTVFARWCRRRGTPLVIELHEDLDSGEAAIPVIGRLARLAFRRLLTHADAFVVHSEWDRERLGKSLGLETAMVHVIPHGPFPLTPSDRDPRSDREAGGATTVLFFGTIRPYKGLEHLVRAFELLPRDGGQIWKLLIVGETWEGWTEPLDLVRQSSWRSDIEVVNRYVADDELPGFFGRADIVALPYLRSSASGPLHLTMSAGLPVVVSTVGGLVEAASEYSGAVLVPPAEPSAIADGIVRARALTGTTHGDVASWNRTADRYERVLAGVQGRPGRTGRAA